MCSTVTYFEIFCNLGDITNAVPAATNDIIQIQGFLQLGESKAKTRLDKMLTPALSIFLAGQWARCEGGLCGNEAYENCMLANKSWMPIQKMGVCRETNIGKGIKRRQISATVVITALNPSKPFFPSTRISIVFFHANVCKTEFAKT